jgi:hypothetical protein
MAAATTGRPRASNIRLGLRAEIEIEWNDRLICSPFHPPSDPPSISSKGEFVVDFRLLGAAWTGYSVA